METRVTVLFRDLGIKRKVRKGAELSRFPFPPSRKVASSNSFWKGRASLILLSGRLVSAESYPNLTPRRSINVDRGEVAAPTGGIGIVWERSRTQSSRWQGLFFTILLHFLLPWRSSGTYK
jgi:hypothetical protein